MIYANDYQIDTARKIGATHIEATAAGVFACRTNSDGNWESLPLKPDGGVYHEDWMPTTVDDEEALLFIGPFTDFVNCFPESDIWDYSEKYRVGNTCPVHRPRFYLSDGTPVFPAYKGGRFKDGRIFVWWVDFGGTPETYRDYDVRWFNRTLYDDREPTIDKLRSTLEWAIKRGNLRLNR